MSNAKTPDKCINPTCDRTSRSRGLCDCCYNTAHRLVREGQTTWLELETTGRARKAFTGPLRIRSETIAWLLNKNRGDLRPATQALPSPA